MKKLQLFFLFLLLFPSTVILGSNFQVEDSSEILQQINHITIAVNEENEILFEEEVTQLEKLKGQITEKIDFFVEKGFEIPTVTVRVFETTPEEILENIKAEIKKTSIDYVDVQRIKKVKELQVTDSIIAKYRTIISTWKNQSAEERKFTKEDVHFVREVYQKMNFNQFIRAGKLPSFVPKVEELDSIH